MSGKRVKWLNNLVKTYDVQLLLTLRNIYGEKTNNFDEIQLLEKAKKCWKNKVPGIEKWGRK